MEVNGWVGNIVEDPALEFTSSGIPTMRLRFATNRSYTDKNGNKVDKSAFFTLRLWRDLATNVAESGINTRTRLMVSGEFSQRQYETEDGQKRTVEEIEVTEIGPSLRWAKVSGIERTTSGNGGNRGGNSGGNSGNYSNRSANRGNGNSGGNGGWYASSSTSAHDDPFSEF